MHDLDDTITVTRTVISPRAGQLMLRSRKPTISVSDHERETAQNRERQERWRERQADSKRGGFVEWSEAVLDMIVETEYIDDDKTDDPKAVAKAISEMLEDAAKAQAWKKKW